MRSIIGLIGLTLFAAACTRDPLFSGSPRSTHEPPTGRHRTDSSAGEDIVPPGEHIYLTAVRFPDGYAWQEDTCAVDGPVWIDLYRDGALVRSVPAGGSVHPDMHRFMDGHLYTDCSIGTETVVCRDGVELFRFEGREALRGFLVREDGVHTLGQDRDGDGFTYRVMLGGELLHSLQEVSGIRAFGFLNGKPCRVQSTGRRCLLYVDDKSSDLAVRTGESILWCRMTAWEDDILVLFCVSGTAGRRCFLQASDGKTFQGDKEETVEEMLVEGKRVGWTVTGERGDLLRVRWSDGTATEAAGGYLISGRCALLQNGHLLLALTGRDGTPNRFQQDKEKTDIPFNGYFTSVTVE